MSPKIQHFIEKIGPKITNDPNFRPIYEFLNSNVFHSENLLYSASVIEDVDSMGIENDPLLRMIHDYRTVDRGDKKGKGELTFLFLLENAIFGTDCDIQIGDQKYEVKCTEKENEAMTFGIDNTFTLTKFGPKLIDLFDKIREKSELDGRELPSECGFWYERKNRKGSSWEARNSPKVEKLIGLEITPSEFHQLFTEIPKLKGVIDHPYVHNIKLFEEHYNAEKEKISKRGKNVVVFQKYKMVSYKAELEMGPITQSKFKMVLKGSKKVALEDTV